MTVADKKLVEEISGITEMNYFASEDEMTELDIFREVIKDLKIEYMGKCQELDDYKDEVEDTMRPLTMEEYTGSAAYRGY